MNHTAGTSDVVGGSLCVSQPQQCGSPSNTAAPLGLIWREITLPISVISDCFIVSSSDVVQPGWLLTYLRNICPAQIEKMRQNLAKYSMHFIYSSPAQPLGPEDLVWRMMAGKLVNIKLHTRRSQRVVKESRSICTCDSRRPNSTTLGHLL